MVMVKNKDKKPYHQDTKGTKQHKVNVLFFFVFLGVLVVRHLKSTDDEMG